MGKLNLRAVLAEFLGSMFYMLFFTFGAESSTQTDRNLWDSRGIGIPFIAFGLGAYLVAMSLAFGDLSGAHFNPAITVMMIISKNIGALDGILYIVANFLGGILGIGFKIAFRGIDSYQSHLRIQNDDGSHWGTKMDAYKTESFNDHNSRGLLWTQENLEDERSGSFFIEMFGCLLFFFVILNQGCCVTKEHSNYSPNNHLVYGAAFTTAAIGVNYMGGATSLNPGRALCTAIFETYGGSNPHYIAGGDQMNTDEAPSTGHENLAWWSRENGGKQFYVWFVAPFFAAVLAAVLMKVFRGTWHAGDKYRKSEKVAPNPQVPTTAP